MHWNVMLLLRFNTWQFSLFLNGEIIDNFVFSTTIGNNFTIEGLDPNVDSRIW